MIRFNEERIGRQRIYFAPGDNTEYDPYTDWVTEPTQKYGRDIAQPGDRRESWHGTDERLNRTGDGSTPSGAPSIDPTRFGGTGPSSVTNYTNISGTGTSSVVSAPKTAAEAQAAARSGASETARRAATERNSGTGAIKERMNVATTTDNEILTTGDVIRGLPSNIIGRGSVRDNLRQRIDAGRKTGLRDAQSILERGGTMDEAIESYINKVTGENTMTTSGGSYTTLNNNLFLADLQAIRDAFGATASAAAAAVADLSSANTVEEATSKVENSIKEAISKIKANSSGNSAKGARDTNKFAKSMFSGMEDLLESGKSPSIIKSAVVRAASLLNKLGMTSAENCETPRAQKTVAGFVSQFQLGKNMENAEFVSDMQEAQQSFVGQIKTTAIIDLAETLGLSAEEVKKLRESVEAVTNMSKSVEERAAALNKLTADILEKWNSGISDKAKAEYVKLLEGIFVQQVDKATLINNESKAQSNFIKEMKDSTEQEVDNVIDTAVSIKDETKKELALCKELEKFVTKLKMNTPIEAMKEVITDETEACYQVARDRSHKFSKGKVIAASIMKIAAGILTMPFCPKFAIKIIKNGAGCAADAEERSQVIPVGMPIEEAMNSPELRNDMIELFGEDNVEKERAKETQEAQDDVAKKLTKALSWFALNLVTGNILGALFSAIKLIYYSTKLASYSTDPTIKADGNAELLDESLWKDENGEWILPETAIKLLIGTSKYSYGTKYENEYEKDWQEGGNQNVETSEGFNQGVGSEEEYLNYIRNNIQHDRALRAATANL